MMAWDRFLSSAVPDARETVPVKNFPSPWASRRAPAARHDRGSLWTTKRLGVIQTAPVERLVHPLALA